CTGVVMVASAGMTIGSGEPVTISSIILSRATAYAAIAFGLLLLVGQLPLRRFCRPGLWQGLIPLLYPISLVCLLLVYVPGVGRTVKGAARWVDLPGVAIGFQPSEVAKWCTILVMAWWGVRKGASLRRFTTGLLPPLIALGIVSAIVTLEDLGTGVLIACAGTAVLVAAGARVWQLALLAPIGVAGVALALLVEPYRLRRLDAFTNPFEDPQGAGYHIIQSLVAISNGDVFGRGLGFGLQKFGYLPEDRTDFLFAIICEELGIAGAIGVMGMYALLLCSGLVIVARTRLRLLQLAGVGVLATVGGQTLMNLFVVTGLAPTKGIALPLLSAGGTGWMLTAASLGLLIAMDRETNATERFEVLIEGVTPDDALADRPAGDDETNPTLQPA
ncbi:MAG: putative peptidoglycan glycosyltransferase FtsW, partial [Planctomycetota bacterium]